MNVGVGPALVGGGDVGASIVFVTIGSNGSVGTWVGVPSSVTSVGASVSACVGICDALGADEVDVGSIGTSTATVAVVVEAVGCTLTLSG